MITNDSVQKFEQIKKQIKTGDYITLGEMLKIETSAARMRFLRQDSLAVEAMGIIINNRNRLIKTFQSK